MLFRSIRFRVKPGATAYYGIALAGVAFCAMVVLRMEKEHRIQSEGVRVIATVQGSQPLSGANAYLRYSYEVGGKRYSVRELVSDRVARKAAAGDRIEVWLLPERPSDPLLENRGVTPLWVGLLIGLSFVAGGLFGLFQLRRNPS